MNEQQKYLLESCGYEYLDSLGFIRQNKKKDRFLISYNVKSQRFVLSIPKSELMTDKDLKTFQKEFDDKFTLVYILNAMEKINEIE